MAIQPIDKATLKQVAKLANTGHAGDAAQLLYRAGITQPAELSEAIRQLPIANPKALETALGEYKAKLLKDYQAGNAPKVAPVTQVSVGKGSKAAGGALAPAAPPTEADKINAQFGNDMAWLDPQFKAKPELLGPAARSGVFADPQLIAKQNQALDSLFGVARDGGATAQERARRAGARRDSEDWLRGQREADMSNLNERGMSGSGAELLTLGNDRQAAAQRNSAADLQTDAWLEQRALDAMMAGGDLAGKMRDTGFKEASDRATATDEFSLLNNEATNKAETDYKDFQQKAWADALRARNEWDAKKLQLGLNTAGGLLSTAVGENQAGLGYGKDTATADVGTYNEGRKDVNDFVTGVNTKEDKAAADSDHALGELFKNDTELNGQIFNTIASAGAGGGGGMAGMAGMAGAGGGGPSSSGGTYSEEEVFGK